MKKFTTYFILFCLALSCNVLLAQSIIKPSASVKNDAVSHSQLSRGGTDKTQALFDIQFDYPLLPSIPAGALAGCVYTGTEFWVTNWNYYDSIFTLSPTGTITSRFQITGVGSTVNGGTGGVRALTFDGTYIYAADNTTTIKKINPTTKTVVGTITSTAPFSVRGLAYDSTANSGAGGFWVSAFSSDFYLISMTGAVLRSIPLAGSGATTAYGIAFDPYTAGGPYLWVFDQLAGAAATLVRISTTTGLSNLTHNTQPDFGAGNGLAGGLAITDRYAPPARTIIGVQQNTLHLFGYELSDYVQATIDASVDSLFFDPPYTQVPTFEVTPFTWTARASNLGANTITDLATTFTLNDGVSNVFAPAASHNANVATSATVSNNFGPYTPALGAYTAQAIVSTGSQTDQVISNDTVRYNMFITDSVMARDDNTSTGALGIGGTPGSLGQYFHLANAAYITSVTYLCNSPSMGDSTNVDIYTFPGVPMNVIGSTPFHIFSLADSTNGVVLTLPISGGPLLVGAGDYFIAVNEHDQHAWSNVSLGTTTFNFQPLTTWVKYGAISWTPLEQNAVPFYRTFLLRLNVASAVSVVEIDHQKFSIYPNPASTQLTIESHQSTPSYKVEVYDMLGNKVMETAKEETHTSTLNVSALEPGIYFAKTIVGDKSTTTKISITR